MLGFRITIQGVAWERYNRAMPTAARRRAGVATLLGLLAGALLLMAAPGNPGALRLAGISLLWWYAALAAPLAAVLVVAAVERGAGAKGAVPAGSAALGVAAWASPVILAVVAASVFSGTAEAPAAVLAITVAPLIALLVPATHETVRENPVAPVATGLSIGLVLWANLSLLGDVARALGYPRWAATLVAAALALMAVRLRADFVAGGKGLTLLCAGVLGFVVPVAVVALTVAVSPWSAWRDVASRPALTFGERHSWVTEGRTLTAPVALEFTEAHRVTALAPATFRVFELDRLREWQLRAGDALSLRPGDRLVLDAGARLKFEAGKRVPGAAASGAAWADPPERGTVSTAARALGAVFSLVGGALALFRSRRAVAGEGLPTGAGLLFVLVLIAACLGIYSAYAAPGLSIGVPALAAVFGLPAAVVPGAPGRTLALVGAAGLLMLFLATATALRDILDATLDRSSRSKSPFVSFGPPAVRAVLADPTTVILVVAAAAAVLWPGDASRLLFAGLGLTASIIVAPGLAGADRWARLAGSLAGMIALAGVATYGSRLPGWAGVVWTYPALAAAPLAWTASRVWNVAAASRR